MQGKEHIGRNVKLIAGFVTFLLICLLAACPNPAGEGSKSSNNSLSSLTITYKTGESTAPAISVPGFDPALGEYTIEVPNTVTAVIISALKADAKATTNPPDGNVELTLTAGVQKSALITVTAEDGSKKTYTVKVTRKDDIAVKGTWYCKMQYFKGNFTVDSEKIVYTDTGTDGQPLEATVVSFDNDNKQMLIKWKNHPAESTNYQKIKWEGSPVNKLRSYSSNADPTAALNESTENLWSSVDVVGNGSLSRIRVTVNYTGPGSVDSTHNLQIILLNSLKNGSDKILFHTSLGTNNSYLDLYVPKAETAVYTLCVYGNWDTDDPIGYYGGFDNPVAINASTSQEITCSFDDTHKLGESGEVSDYTDTMARFGADSYFPIIEGMVWIDDQDNPCCVTSVDTVAGTFRIENNYDSTKYLNGKVIIQGGIEACVYSDGHNDSCFLPVSGAPGYFPLLYETGKMRAGETWGERGYTINGHNVRKLITVNDMDCSVTCSEEVQYSSCIKLTVDLTYPDGPAPGFPTLTKQVLYYARGIGCVQSELYYADASANIIRYLKAYGNGE